MLNDPRVRFALGVGLIEWLLIGFLILSGRENAVPLVVLILGVGGAFQFGALFTWRRANTPFMQAQALYTQGRYEEVIQQLTALETEDPRMLALLGNTYRQLGRLDDSEAILRRAHESAPEDPFPMYGLGRTVLAKGSYQEAATLIQTALANRGHKVIRAELALAYYLAGLTEEAAEAARLASRNLRLEPYRALMVNYILHRVKEDERALPYMKRVRDGLAYWYAEAERFRETPYGERIQEELLQIENLLGKGDAYD